MADDAAAVLFTGKLDKVRKTEKQQIVCGHNQQVVIDSEFVHREQKVAHSSQAGFIGLGSVIHNGYRLAIMLISCPFLKNRGEFMVGDDDILINLINAINIIKHPAQDGALPYFQQWFGKISGQFAQAGGISCRYYNCLHPGVVSDLNY